MKRLKHIIISALTLCLLFGSMQVQAEETMPDPEKTGSIMITIKDKDTPVPGGCLMAYQVADLVVSEEAFYYELTPEFKESGLVITDTLAGKTAEELNAFAQEQKLTGRKMPINEAGVAKVKDLPLGLYLVVQTETAEGYAPVKSFLVAVPMLDDGTFVYDVDASPKVDTETEPPKDPPKPPTPPHKVPQTGQLWWPVPILAIMGVILFSAGWLRKKSEE